GWRTPSAIAPNEQVVWSGKLRLSGHAVAGALWGLLLGVGIGLLGWQDGRWTVNRGSVVILPVLTVAVAGLLAWLGWGYRIRDVVVLPRRPEPAPEPVMSAPVQPAPDETAAIGVPTPTPTPTPLPEPTSGDRV